LFVPQGCGDRITEINQKSKSKNKKYPKGITLRYPTGQACKNQKHNIAYSGEQIGEINPI